jgi:hypothetical protein
MMFVYTQAFHYFAHRVQDTLEEEEPPHIVGLKRSVMITILRCHLSEHPYRRLRACDTLPPSDGLATHNVRVQLG